MAAEPSTGNNTLPDTYKQVEYIQSSGTQYINTGYIPSNNTKIEMSMGGWNQTGTYNNLFGARLEWSATGRGFHLGYDSNTPTFFWMFGGKFSSGSGLSFNDGSNHSIEMSQSGIYEDGTLKETISSATFTSPVNMYIFCDNNNGTAAEYGVYKLYYFKIYNSGTLVRNFIPVIRKSDNKPGLYDLVNGAFYTNAGTGEFSYPAQNGKIKKILLGTNLIRPEEYCYTPTSNTKLYYPFVNSQLDITGNTTLGKSLTQQSKGYKYSSGSEDRDISFTTYVGTRFFCYWMYCNTLPTNKYVRVIPTDYGYMHFIPTDSTTSHARNTVYVMGNSSTSPYQNSWYYSGQKTITLGQWNHFAYGIGSDNKYIWVLNGTSMRSGTASGTAFNNTSMISNLFGGNDAYEITLLDLIGEDRVRTLSEIQTYYNKSKSYYGL